MKFKFLRCLMADGGGAGGTDPQPKGGADPKGAEPKGTEPKGTEPKGIDENALFTKIDEIIEKRTSGLAKSILKENGLEGDELTSLLQAYKTNKVTQTQKQQENNNKLKDENTQLKEQILDMQFKAKVNELASKLEFSSDADKYLDKLLVKEDYLNDKSEIEEDKLKKGLEQVLKDLPALKGTNSKGIHYMGGKGNEGQDPQTDDALRRAFGLSVKK